jgi:hypothetical protein
MNSLLEGLTPEQLKQFETAEKLFRLAGKNPNKHEADAAAAKGMAILEALNLDMSAIEEGGSEKVKRADERMAGGLYKWQRDLWESIAELHFCYYWSMYQWDPDKKNLYQSRKQGRRINGGFRFEHRLVGKVVNIVATKNMAEYLQDTIERLTRDHVTRPEEFFTNYAVSYRQGIAEEVIKKIYDRRQDLLREERRKEQEAAEKAAASGMAGVSTSRAMTLGSVLKQEEEANYDFLNGDGAWARRLAERAERAKKAEEAAAAYTAWAAEHPEEARKQEEERRKNRRRTPWNAGMRTEKDTRDWSAYKAGREVGERVGIDPQAGARKTAGAIG